MEFENLTAEQKELVKACKSPEELAVLAAKEGYELSDTKLEAISGGSWSCMADGCGEFLGTLPD